MTMLRRADLLCHSHVFLHHTGGIFKLVVLSGNVMKDHSSGPRELFQGSVSADDTESGTAGTRNMSSISPIPAV
jgi:hypothetical protein